MRNWYRRPTGKERPCVPPAHSDAGKFDICSTTLKGKGVLQVCPPCSGAAVVLWVRGDAAMIDQQLLEILACPEDKSPVTLADEALVATINQAIAAGRLTNRGGIAVSEAIEGGLVRQDGRWLYPIRDEIPIMLIEEAIALPPPKAD